MFGQGFLCILKYIVTFNIAYLTKCYKVSAIASAFVYNSAQDLRDISNYA